MPCPLSDRLLQPFCFSSAVWMNLNTLALALCPPSHIPASSDWSCWSLSLTLWGDFQMHPAAHPFPGQIFPVLGPPRSTVWGPHPLPFRLRFWGSAARPRCRAQSEWGQCLLFVVGWGSLQIWCRRLGRHPRPPRLRQWVLDSSLSSHLWGLLSAGSVPWESRGGGLIMRAVRCWEGKPGCRGNARVH